MKRTVVAVTASAIALAAALAPAALGQASNDPKDANTVISIEGKTSNMLLPGWVAVPKTGTRVVRDSAGQKVRISGRSVLSQAITGTSAYKVRMKWSWYQEFNAPWITSIGGVGAKGANGWNFRVNSLYKAKAANGVNLTVGDRVTWYWGQEFATVLEIAAPVTGTAPAIAPGAVVDPGTFTVTINEVTAKNKRSPSSGATVTYGTATATTDANGQATLTAIAGTNVLRVTKAARIAATKQLCTKGGADCPS